MNFFKSFTLKKRQEKQGQEKQPSIQPRIQLDDDILDKVAGGAGGDEDIFSDDFSYDADGNPVDAYEPYYNRLD